MLREFGVNPMGLLEKDYVLNIVMIIKYAKRTMVGTRFSDKFRGIPLLRIGEGTFHKIAVGPAAHVAKNGKGFVVVVQ